MKLRERFLDIIEHTKPHWYKVDAESCEKIADDFAIGFAEWLTISYPNQRKFLLKQGNLRGFYSTKELLEIYKKEKGL